MFSKNDPETAVLHVRTPFILSQPLSKFAGFDVYLKLDNLQCTSTFKDRGVGHLCRKAVKGGSTHIVCPSGGNAGLAAANSARQLGIKATICVPQTTPEFTIEKLRQYGATVEVIGEVWDETDIHARKLASLPGYTYVTPFDHADVWEGNSTMVNEIATDMNDFKPGVVVLSVGGGGLFCGVIEGLKKVGWDDVPVIAMETKGADSLSAALHANQPVTIAAITSIAKSLGSKKVCDQCFNYCHQHPVFSEVVSDKDAVHACLNFADDHRMLVEPACGASLSAVYSNVIHRLQAEGKLGKLSNAVIIVCGGNSVTLELLEKWRKQFDL